MSQSGYIPHHVTRNTTSSNTFTGMTTHDIGDTMNNVTSNARKLDAGNTSRVKLTRGENKLERPLYSVSSRWISETYCHILRKWPRAERGFGFGCSNE